MGFQVLFRFGRVVNIGSDYSPDEGHLVARLAVPRDAITQSKSPQVLQTKLSRKAIQKKSDAETL
jgi:hypothetical protein